MSVSSSDACVGASSPFSWLLFEERDSTRGDGGGGATSPISDDRNTDEATPPERSPSLLSRSGRQNKYHVLISK